MKKLKLLLTPLMAISFLANCGGGGGGGGDKELKFSVPTERIVVKENIATVYVDWTPEEHVIEFAKCSYVTSTGDRATAELVEPEAAPRPMPIKLDFQSKITEDKKGTLSFSYRDKTSGKSDKENITFTIPAPTDLNFNVTESTVEYNTALEEATVELNWKIKHRLSFVIGEIQNITFEYDSTIAPASTTHMGTGPAEIVIDFSGAPLTETVTGVLNFAYKDLDDAGKEYEGKVENITINVNQPEPSSYNFTFSGTHCSAEHDSSYVEGGLVELEIISDDKDEYILPSLDSEIEVENVTEYDYVYNSLNNTATLSFTMPANDVVVTVEAKEAVYITAAIDGISFGSDKLEQDRTLKGEEYAGTINVETEGYVLPENLESVKYDGTGTDITQYCTYSRNENLKSANLVIPADYNTGPDIVIDLTLQPAPQFYSFSFNGENCGSQDVESEYPAGASVKFTILPYGTMEGEHELPETLPDGAVTGVDNYTYVLSDNGSATFECTMPEGDVSITITATLKPFHKVTFNGVHCSATFNTESWDYQEGQPVYTIDIEPEEGYELPETLPDGAVTGVDTWDYGIDDEEEGTGLGYFSCTMGISDITITITAIAI